MTRRHKWIMAVVLCVLTGCDGWYRSGDRVLVSKFHYETGVEDPRRFDVVVFKYPETPTKNGVPRNYIKRLLGLPGELLAIVFGQLFRLPPPEPGQPPHFDDLKNLNDAQKEIVAKRLWIKRHYYDQAPHSRNWNLSNAERETLLQFVPKDLDKKVDAVFQLTEAEKDLLVQQLWIKQLALPYVIGERELAIPDKERDVLRQLDRTMDFTHTNHKDSRLWFRLGKFQPVRKPPEVMLAMRRIVYDNDFPAADLVRAGVRPRWQAVPGWNNIDEHGFRSEKGNQESWLNYQHILARKEKELSKQEIDPTATAQEINDFLDYNSSTGHGGPSNWVGDLMIECKVTVHEPKGEFALRLNRGNLQYQARWDLATGTCKLLRRDHNDSKGWVELKSENTALKQAGTYQVRLANFDSRLTVWVDGALPFGNGHEYTPPEMPTADEIKDAKDGTLDHDGFLNRLNMRCTATAWDKSEPAGIGVKDAQVDVHNIRVWRDTYYTGVGDKGAEPKHLIMYVQPKHYLVLGDNSQSSSDSRAWGLVPERLLLGRALTIYFPFDRAGAIR